MDDEISIEVVATNGFSRIGNKVDKEPTDDDWKSNFSGRTFVVIPVGRLDPPRGVTRGIDPDFQKFDRALVCVKHSPTAGTTRPLAA